MIAMTHKKIGEPTKTYKSLFRNCIKSDFYEVQDFEVELRFCPET